MAIWALVFLIVVFPFSIYATWSDLKFLKIPNILPMSLAITFVIVGPFVLPFYEYLNSLIYGFIALMISLVIFAARLVPGGDLKYATSLIPFVNTHELVSFAMFVSLAALTAVFTHLLFGWLKLAPEGWASWQGGGLRRRFPVAFALSGGILIYLAAHLIQPV